MSTRITILKLVLVLALLGIGNVSAGVYKWTDENGKTHFSDKPPPGQEVETIETKSKAADASSNEKLEEIKARAEERLKAREEKKQAAEEKKKKEKEMAAFCEKSRKNLENLLNSTRRQIINDKGEREFLAEEQRQEWIKTAREQIKKHCGK